VGFCHCSRHLQKSVLCSFPVAHFGGGFHTIIISLFHAKSLFAWNVYELWHMTYELTRKWIDTEKDEMTDYSGDFGYLHPRRISRSDYFWTPNDMLVDLRCRINFNVYMQVSWPNIQLQSIFSLFRSQQEHHTFGSEMFLSYKVFGYDYMMALFGIHK
jgi:hypothetical protein